MTTEQALQIIANVLGEFKGTLKDHQQLQTALKLIAELVNKNE